MKDTTEKLEKHDIQQTTDMYAGWNTEREMLVEKQIREYKENEIRKDLERRLLELKEKEEKLTYFENTSSIALKARYARALGLAGMMWWEASDDKADPTKEMRPSGIFQLWALGHLRDGKTGRKVDRRFSSFGVERGFGGKIDSIGTGFASEFDVSIDRARVGVEVFVRRELRRVDEDAGNDLTTAPCRRPNQRKVPLMKGTHGGNEAATR